MKTKPNTKGKFKAFLCRISEEKVIEFLEKDTIED